MRTVVSDLSVLEDEVKPHELLEEYRRLLELDMGEIALDDLVVSACPGCSDTEAREAFKRSGMQYLSCNACQTLYVSPRPPEKVLTHFYRNARSVAFWRDEFLPATREIRRVKLFRPRAQWLLDVVDEYCPNAKTGIAAGYNNHLLIEELLAQEDRLFSITVTNAAADIEFADLVIPGVSVCPMPIAQWDSLEPTDVFMAFDILDRCADPDAFFAGARATIAPGGLLLITTTLGSGFDIQVLWDAVEGVYPPERLNLFSVEGLSALFAQHGFEALEFSTPGMFDVETVKHMMETQPNIDVPRFIRYLINNRGEEAIGALQEYLQRFRLSSFGRIALRKIDV